MDDDDRFPAPPPDPRPGVDVTELAGGAVRRVDSWAVGMSNGEPFAVSRRCRHQLGDLAQGTVDADGCLVCPWHGARYDVGDGRMVRGPKGFLGYHGPTRLYGAAVQAYSRLLPLRRRRARINGGRLEIDEV